MCCADLLSRGQVQLFLESPGQHDRSANHPFASSNPNLVVLAQNVLAAALSDSTRSSYRSAVNHIAKFHEKQNSNLFFPSHLILYVFGWHTVSINSIIHPFAIIYMV